MKYLIALIIAIICSLVSFAATFISFINNEYVLGIAFLSVFALAIYITTKLKGEL